MSKASDLRYQHDMAYLDTESFQCRQVLAAHFLRSCPTILEIGGFISPISNFLQHHPERVVIVDPRITAGVESQLHGQPCRFERIRKRIQDCDVELAAGSYGFVLLGYSLKGMETEAGQSVHKRLLTLVANAAVAVLEYAPDWPLAAAAMDRLMGELANAPALDLGLDLGAGHSALTEYPRRRLLVYRNASRSDHGQG